MAADQLRSALHRLRDGFADDRVSAIHDARKSLKKTRSLLRLARPGMLVGRGRGRGHDAEHGRDEARGPA